MRIALSLDGGAGRGAGSGARRGVGRGAGRGARVIPTPLDLLLEAVVLEKDGDDEDALEERREGTDTRSDSLLSEVEGERDAYRGERHPGREGRTKGFFTGTSLSPQAEVAGVE